MKDCSKRGEDPPEELAEEGDASLHRWAFERPAVAQAGPDGERGKEPGAREGKRAGREAAAAMVVAAGSGVGSGVGLVEREAPGKEGRGGGETRAISNN